jgi:hypothetical protein
MKTLKSLMVVPQFSPANQITGAALTRYLESDGYRRTLQGSVSDLPVPAQVAFSTVVAQAQQLRAPDERIAQVFGELLGSVPDLTHAGTEQFTDPETGLTASRSITVVDTYRHRISLALTLRKLDDSGERTMTIDTEQLSPEARTAVLTLWQLLAA